MTDTVRRCQILGGLKNRSFTMTQLHWKFFYVATWQETSRNVKLWKISSNKEGIQGPMNQRSDFTEAMHKCKIPYDEHTEITGEGNKPIPPAQQDRQRLCQQFDGLEG